MANSYVDRVMAKIAAGKAQSSLGPLLVEGSEAAARKIFAMLVAMGIQPQDTVVDYGCGTLRIGALFIDFLEPDRYFGLDIDQRLLDMGAGMLPVRLASKRPSLRIISSAAVAEVAAAEPDWVFSKGVAHHVPPDELAGFFGSIGALCSGKTTVVVYVSKLEAVSRQKSKYTWCHSPADLERAIAGAGLIIKEFQSSDNARKFLVVRKA